MSRSHGGVTASGQEKLTNSHGNSKFEPSYVRRPSFMQPLAAKERRAIKYKRIQNKIYNILERPKDWKAVSYHVLSFAVVFACLVLGVIQSADDSVIILNQVSMIIELLMLLWFATEYFLRVWSSACRSKYQSTSGRLRFMRRPLCVVDAVVILASTAVVVMNASTGDDVPQELLQDEHSDSSSPPGSNMVPALRGLRFFQIMRMMRLDRRGSSWRLLSSVIWAHRQELFTAIYTGFLVLVFASFAMFIVEKDQMRTVNGEEINQFKTYADALWWGVITLCTVGYGDKVPQTAIGKVIGAGCAVIGISFFALPPGILGSGLALKVQQQQRQKHQIRRRIPAAQLIQSVWRCCATEVADSATWNYYAAKMKVGAGRTVAPPAVSVPTPQNSQQSNFVSRAFSFRKPFPRKEVEAIDGIDQAISRAAVDWMDSQTREVRRQSSVGGWSLTGRRGRRASCAFFVDESSEKLEFTQAFKTVIRATRKMRFLVAKRKFREALRPYDVKDVIEQYSSGHADILSRLRHVQHRMDQILGRNGDGVRDSLADRVTTVEAKLDNIDAKLTMLLRHSLGPDVQIPEVPSRSADQIFPSFTRNHETPEYSFIEEEGSDDIEIENGPHLLVPGVSDGALIEEDGSQSSEDPLITEHIEYV